MISDQQQQLLQQAQLPSPSAAVLRLLECARDSEVDLGKVAHAISFDPALAAKVLRLANSPLYAQRRRSANIRQAVVALGLTTALTLALSVTIWSSVSSAGRSDAHYPWVWRRAVLSGVAARRLGEATGLHDVDDLFLAGLLQDLAVLALGQAIPDLYAGMPVTSVSHGDLMARERARIGTDHAGAGAWLLASWGLPERICTAIERSHRSEFRQSRSESDKFDSCVRVAGLLADCILRQEETRIAREVAAMVERSLGISRPRFAEVLEGIYALQKEVQTVFDAGASAAAISEETLLRARAGLTGGGSGTEPDGAELPATAISRILELDKPAQLDPVTGVLNDDTLVRLLEREFQYATKHGWPLSVLVIGARRLNASSKNSAQAFDQQELVAIAHYLFASTRDTDALARHKVEQFALILPGTDGDAAERVAHRLSSRADRIVAVDGRSVPVALLIGIASIDGDRVLSSAGELLQAAAARLA